jgi:hypothetical protein
VGRIAVQDCPRLDIRALKQRGWRFGYQALNYTNGSSISFVGTRDALALSYRLSGESVSYEIRVVRSPVHFGGEREWLLCPDCRKRFDLLYIANRRFLCRRCNRLAYQTQWEKRAGRQLIKVERLWKRAGHEFSGEGQRPRYMQRQTYDRLMERADEAYGASWDTPMMRRLMAEVER